MNKCRNCSSFQRLYLDHAKCNVDVCNTLSMVCKKAVALVLNRELQAGHEKTTNSGLCDLKTRSAKTVMMQLYRLLIQTCRFGLAWTGITSMTSWGPWYVPARPLAMRTTHCFSNHCCRRCCSMTNDIVRRKQHIRNIITSITRSTAREATPFQRLEDSS